MIYTLTLNPSIDYHVWMKSLTAGTIHEVHKDWKVAGGKGINVSKVLKILGLESTALGFVGGFTGAFIQQQMEQAGIQHRFIQLEQDSRINLKIKAETETDITGVSPEIPAEALQRLYTQLHGLAPGDYLVLAGSVPNSLPENVYRTIMEELQTKGVQIILDAKGDALKQSLAARPFLIKPNHHELGELFGVSITSAEDALIYGERALELGAQNVIVSLAGEGAVFINRKNSYVARIPRNKPVNSIGAGDSMVAGFLYAYSSSQDLEDVFTFAVAAGSTTALSEGFCTPEKIAEFIPQIKIEK